MNSPVEYIELNMSNYSNSDVSQLNEWAIWASKRLDAMEILSHSAWIGEEWIRNVVERCPLDAIGKKIGKKLLTDIDNWLAAMDDPQLTAAFRCDQPKPKDART